ncbi:MAG: D-glycero-beta-D-manno-heptose-7-phosphate kinase [Planctomycetota bacterium]
MNSQDLESIVLKAGHPRILIVGDLILDRYVSGDVSRISPEAPIPILTARSSEERLGGAGNVAANLVAMGAVVDVAGVLGDDGWGKALRDLLEKQGIGTSACTVDSSRPTILKTRMMSGAHQMLRVDNEDARPVTGKANEELVKKLPERVKQARAVVLSDYGKGCLSREVIAAVVAAAKAARVPVLVDPKGEDYSRYRGATLVTPNRKEAEEAVGRKLGRIEEFSRAADELMEMAGLEAAVITLGGGGIYFKSRKGETGHVPAQARAVFDVTGAGDTVIAQIAFHVAEGRTLEVAVELANQAAGIVVGRLGTHAVTRTELLARLRETRPHEGKVLRVAAELDHLLAAWRKEKKRIVFTNGCFDVLHVGHIEYLRFARGKGDALIVAVNDDASVKRLKGEGRPVNSLEDRMVVLAALEMVDAVCAFPEDTPAVIVERVTPDVLVKGEDWAEKGVVGREWVEKHGGVVHLAPLVPGKSTTGTLEKVRKSQES